jgi:outer membrane protein assembly factor BamB
MHGRWIAKTRKGEIVSDKPNEIDGNIFSYQNLVYVPLRGGQLLALNAKDGSMAWLFEQEVSGAYQLFGNKIYKKNVLAIYEIDALTGEILRTMPLDKNPDLHDKIFAGPLWVYDDIIIILHVPEGYIALIDRACLKVVDLFGIGFSIINWDKSVVWHENKLYVHDTAHNLHIFEKE